MTLDRPGADEPGIIGETYEDGFPVVLKLVDGPSELVNSQMLALENALDQSLESPGLCRHAYSRTGNGLKELAYYIHERDQFMEAFNTAWLNTRRVRSRSPSTKTASGRTFGRFEPDSR